APADRLRAALNAGTGLRRRHTADRDPVLAEGLLDLVERLLLCEAAFSDMDLALRLQADGLEPGEELLVALRGGEPLLEGRARGGLAGEPLGPVERRQGLRPLALPLKMVCPVQGPLQLVGRLRLPRRPVAHHPGDTA